VEKAGIAFIQLKGVYEKMGRKTATTGTSEQAKCRPGSTCLQGDRMESDRKRLSRSRTQRENKEGTSGEVYGPANLGQKEI